MFFFKIQKRDFLDTFFESLLAFSRTLHAQTFRAGFKGGGKWASHQTVRILFLANDRRQRDYDLAVAHCRSLF